MKTLFLDALSCRNTSRPPVWLMRQAGRYLPEYRAIREKYSFLQMCHNPEIAAQVTLLPLRLFRMDAAILYSDILVIPEALGVGLHFKDGTGPIIERPLNHARDVAELPNGPVTEELQYVARAIRCVLPELEVPLIGFCGAPFTVASYMIEGGSSRDFKKTKQWLFRDPESFHQLLEKITNHTIAYLNLQIDAGVHAIQIFDTWANVLAPQQFRDVSVKYMKRIIEGISPRETPVILFYRGSSAYSQDLITAGPSGLSLDWHADLPAVRKTIPDDVALQGNLDPDILYAPPQEIRKEVEKLLRSMHQDKGYIFNLGHGIKPDMPVEAVRTLVDTVKNYQ